MNVVYKTIGGQSMRDRIPPIEEMEETYGEQAIPDPDVDWKELFFKYADHVGHEEGVDYLNRQTHWIEGRHDENQEWVNGHEEKWCTDREWRAIQLASDEET
jgi:hypothetical protein